MIYTSRHKDNMHACLYITYYILMIFLKNTTHDLRKEAKMDC